MYMRVVFDITGYLSTYEAAREAVSLLLPPLFLLLEL